MKFLIDYHVNEEGTLFFYSAVVEGKNAEEAKNSFKKEKYYIDAVSELKTSKEE